jgi:hypothetical protein
MWTLRTFCAVSAIAFLATSAALAADLTGSWKGQLTATDGSSSEPFRPRLLSLDTAVRVQRTRSAINLNT